MFSLNRKAGLFLACLFTSTVNAEVEPFYPINDDGPPAFVSADLASARSFMDDYLKEELRGGDEWWGMAGNFLSLAEGAAMTGEEAMASIARSYNVKRIDGVPECYGKKYAGSCYFEIGFRIVRHYEIETVRYTNQSRHQVEVVVVFDEVGYTDRLSNEKEREFIADKKPQQRVSYFLEHRENEDIDAEDRESRMGWYFTREVEHRLSCDAVFTYHELEMMRLRRVMETKSGDIKVQLQKWFDRYAADLKKVEQLCKSS